jgi:SAM-dependent methyltransferase
MTQIDFDKGTLSMTATEHYDAQYFQWQRSIGEFSARANLFKFQPHVRPTDRVVDFGCGGAYLLAAIKCADRRGIEVNPIARTEAARIGVTCVAATDELPDEWADVVISNSALEHVEHPLAELRRLLPKIRRGGSIVFCVPHETVAWDYKPGDVNQHLYTWSPMGLGNLFATAGFEIDHVVASRMMWPPWYEPIYNAVGETAFHVICRLYRWTRLALQLLKPVDSHASVIVVARRPL